MCVRAVAAMVSAEELQQGQLLPPLSRIREVSIVQDGSDGV